jgi:hypothetical protein
MTVPLAARDIAAAAGAILILGAVVSVVGTVIVPRNTGGRLTRLVTRVVNGLFRVICRPVAAYRRRDRIMAAQAAVILLGQIAVWLGAFYVGYALLIWPVTESIGVAFTSVGPALWTFGDPNAHGFFETAALDSAALYLALCPASAPAVPTRLCLRSGMVCFGEVARSMGLTVSAEPDPDAGISLGYDEFLDAVARLSEVGFPIQREPEAAWPHFVGWRVNYERAAYAIAEAVDAVPALWSGPRRRPQEQLAPLRPGPGLSA